MVPCSEIIVSTQIPICAYSSFSTRFLFHYFLTRIIIIILQSSVEKNEKLEDITSAVVKELTASCAECGISSDIIDRQSFSCFPESPTHVTFRARLGGSSETDSGSLISLLESWVSDGATIIVTGVLMTVDAKCSVAISSLSEGECSMTTTQPPDTTASSMTSSESTTMMPPDMDTNASSETTSDTSQSSTDNTAAIIGGVVAVVFIIALTVLMLALVLRRRHREFSIRKAEV